MPLHRAFKGKFTDNRKKNVKSAMFCMKLDLISELNFKK